ncbi:MAG: response regulator [Candidatus Omnitrophica bacterium]|nr:response regulator [Candidatus Omnitrophota bacterium]
MGKRILLIEDEKDMVAAITFRLESAGYTIIAAYDGMEGLDKARSENPDLIILDLMLPKMNGYKVCAALKTDEKYKKIPILILSAKAQEVDRKMSEEAGADIYMSKPFEAQELMTNIKNLLKE